jgi:hypothetical protein
MVAQFDGGTITANAGAMLLRQVGHGLGLIRRFARCFGDRRDPRYVEHIAKTLVGRRVFRLALGYEEFHDQAAIPARKSRRLTQNFVSDPNRPKR